MGLASEGIEASPELPTRALARRPLVIVGVLFAVFGALAVGLASEASSPDKVQEEEDALLVPDRASAEALRADATKEPEPAAAAPTAPNENLGVTEQVAPLPPGALLDQQQEAQYQRYLLLVQQDALDARRRARGANLRVASFDAARREDIAEASELLGKLSGQAQGGDQTDLGGLAGGLGGLAQLGAAPALSALSGLRDGAGGGFGPQSGVGGAGQGGADPNLTAAKKDFFQYGGDQLQPGRLASSVRSSAPYELLMGTVIPGVMISGINSEAPGQILGQVSENVYDSATHKHLLIPQGSKLVGTYNATVAKGQARIQVAWVRLNFPNGDKLDLGGMSGADQAGTSGFSDKIDRHFMARLMSALMTTALTVAYEITAPQSGMFYQSAVHRGVGESIVKLGTDMAQQEGQRAPTLRVRPGYRFLIHVSKDIVFRGPYEDGIERSGR